MFLGALKQILLDRDVLGRGLDHEVRAFHRAGHVGIGRHPRQYPFTIAHVCQPLGNEKVESRTGPFHRHRQRVFHAPPDPHRGPAKRQRKRDVRSHRSGAEDRADRQCLHHGIALNVITFPGSVGPDSTDIMPAVTALFRQAFASHVFQACINGHQRTPLMHLVLIVSINGT